MRSYRGGQDRIRERTVFLSSASVLAAILLFFVLSGLSAQDASIVSAIEASRAAQHSVLFENLPATVTDVVDRVVFHESPDGLILQNVSFHRRPYQLSDGTRYVQTPPYESDVFIRQIIENPLAARTLVLLPESGVGQAPWAARFRALAEMERLNPDKDVVVLVDSVGAPTLFSAREEIEAFRSTLTTDNNLGLLLGQVEGFAVIEPALALYGITDRVGLRAAAPPEVFLAKPADPGTAAELAALRTEYLAGAQEFINEMLRGQLLLVVELLQHSIRSAVAESSSLSDTKIDRLNELQIDLARSLARNDTRGLVSNPRNAEIEALLTEIDELIGSDSRDVFETGMNRVDSLITTEFAAAVDPVLDSYRARFAAPAGGAAESARVLAAYSALRETPGGAIAILESPGSDLYRHIEQCMEDGSYNLIVFSDLSASIRRGVPGISDPANLTSLVSRQVAFDAESVFVHPGLDVQIETTGRVFETRPAIDAVVGQPTGGSAPPERGSISAAAEAGLIVMRVLLLDRVRLEYELPKASDEEVIITYSAVESVGGIVSVLHAADTFERRISHYVLPGSSILGQIRSVWELTANDGIEPNELEILRRWALVAQTAFDI